MQSIVSTRRNSQHKSHNFHIQMEEKKKTKNNQKAFEKRQTKNPHPGHQRRKAQND